jgi:cobalt transporter subunit CbtA
MTAFRRLFFAALCAGLLAGVFATVAHQIGTVPIILKAEVYEEAAQHAAAPAHSHGQPAAKKAAPPAWSPADGIERTAYTLLADLLTGTAFALLLIAGLAVRGREIGWREGLFWGLAGFVAFTVAPGLGLPPEIPGTEAAPLLSRQVWWLATAAATAGALALLAFAKRPVWIVVAVIMMVAPHLFGAPQPAEHATAAPASLARQFVMAATVTSFLFWLVLGVATGYFYRRFVPRPSY